MAVTEQSTDASLGRPVLELRGVSVRFGGITAVDGVSLTFGRGCTGLIGPNGAGKTTLLDAVSGLRTPSEGALILDGEDVTSRSAAWFARRGVRRTFQRHQAFGSLSVAENVLVALEWRTRGLGLFGDLVSAPYRRRQTADMFDRVDAVVDRCGLSAVRDQNAASLPIGQLRLLEFARAIVATPQVLLLDEPTSGLGSHETELLGSIVRDLVASNGVTVLLVEHDIDFVMGISDRVVCLERGALLADGRPGEVRSDPAVITAYLGTDSPR